MGDKERNGKTGWAAMRRDLLVKRLRQVAAEEEAAGAAAVAADFRRRADEIEAGIFTTDDE